MKINFQIENLILRGFSLTPTDRTEMTAAIQLELERLLASPGNQQSWANLKDQGHAQGSIINYQPGSSPIRLGREIAASLHSSIQNHPPASQGEKS
jgi:hypothetical protein